MAKGKKIKPPTQNQYNKAELELLYSYGPTIIAYRDCKWPVIEGYCCTFCGSTEPR